jgi:hypothetical protein
MKRSCCSVHYNRLRYLSGLSELLTQIAHLPMESFQLQEQKQEKEVSPEFYYQKSTNLP